MVGIDITTLSLGELQRLSQAARARGQTALAEALAAELRHRPHRIASQPREEPIRMSPVAVPVVPSRVRSAVKAKVRPRWSLAALALLALALGWGVVVPNSSRTPDAPGQVLLVDAPLETPLCPPSATAEEAMSCASPVALGEAFPTPEWPAT